MVDMKNNVHNKKKVADLQIDLKDELDKFYKKKFYKKLEEEVKQHMKIMLMIIIIKGLNQEKLTNSNFEQ